MPRHQLPKGVHKGIRLIVWGLAQGTSQGPIPYTLTQSLHKSPVSPDCFTIVNREWQGVTRNIKEAMYIWVNDPSLNRNLDKYQLPHIWNQVFTGHPITPAQIAQLTIHPPHMDFPPTVQHTTMGAHATSLLVSISHVGGAFPSLSNSTLTPHTPKHPIYS